MKRKAENQIETNNYKQYIVVKVKQTKNTNIVTKRRVSWLWVAICLCVWRRRNVGDTPSHLCISVSFCIVAKSQNLARANANYILKTTNKPASVLCGIVVDLSSRFIRVNVLFTRPQLTAGSQIQLA